MFGGGGGESKKNRQPTGDKALNLVGPCAARRMNLVRLYSGSIKMRKIDSRIKTGSYLHTIQSSLYRHVSKTGSHFLHHLRKWTLF